MTYPLPVATLAVLSLVYLIALDPFLAAAVSVGLFAGPHNWMEVRYLLGRLPSRTGKLKNYFWLSVMGTSILGLTSILLAWTSHALGLRLWNLALIGWVTALVALRGRENPRRSWPWLEPVALVMAAFMWQWPEVFTMFLVFGHPILALFILDRELVAFRRPERKSYHRVLAVLPLGLAVLLWQLLEGNGLHYSDLVSFFTLPHQTPLFLASHTYLELLHYVVWIAILPALARSTGRDALEKFPLLKKSDSRLKVAKGVLLLGLIVTAILWWGFTQDYELTRDLYFRLAVFHVLIEFPFLVRLL